jgi:hypothetical protein
MKLVNLTDHTLRLRTPDHQVQVVYPSGMTARVEEVREAPKLLPGIPVPYVEHVNYGRLSCMPPPEDGVIYLTSRVIHYHPDIRGRDDVYAPDAGPSAVRINGHVYAVTQLMKSPREDPWKN